MSAVRQDKGGASASERLAIVASSGATSRSPPIVEAREVPRRVAATAQVDRPDAGLECPGCCACIASVERECVSGVGLER